MSDATDIVERAFEPARRGHSREHRVLIALNQTEHALLTKLARREERTLAELVRGLVVMAAVEQLQH